MINESGFKIFSNPLTSRCVPFKTSWVKRRNPIRGGKKLVDGPRGEAALRRVHKQNRDACWPTAASFMIERGTALRMG